MLNNFAIIFLKIDLVGFGLKYQTRQRFPSHDKGKKVIFPRGGSNNSQTGWGFFLAKLLIQAFHLKQKKSY